MMEARAAVLARIHDALGRSQTEDAPPVPREYRSRSELDPGSDGALELLIDRLEDYKAVVTRCREDAVGATVAALLAEAASVVVPPALPAQWLDPVTAEVRTDAREASLTHDQLDATAAVVSAARVAIAESGTIVLDGEPDQGRRAITLVPDHHVCVVRRAQVVATVPEAVAILGAHPTRPLTWIAGPSATSDIELVRVEGVHGPRHLDVVIVE